MQLKKTSVHPPPWFARFERQMDCGNGGQKFRHNIAIAKKTCANGFFSNNCNDNKNNDDKIRFQGRFCSRLRVGFMRSYNISNTIYNILYWKWQIHRRTIELNIIIIVMVCVWTITIPPNGRRKCKRGVSQVEKEHLIAGAARVTRARSRQPPTTKIHICRPSFLEIILLYIVWAIDGVCVYEYEYHVPSILHIIMPTNAPHAI